MSFYPFSRRSWGSIVSWGSLWRHEMKNERLKDSSVKPQITDPDISCYLVIRSWEGWSETFSPNFPVGPLAPLAPLAPCQNRIKWEIKLTTRQCGGKKVWFMWSEATPHSSNVFRLYLPEDVLHPPEHHGLSAVKI